MAGVWLENPSPENWRTAFHLAQDAALKHTNTSELVARCATEASATAAGQAGMRLRARTPVFLFRKGCGAEPLPLQFHVSDNDAVFLGGRLAGFLACAGQVAFEVLDEERVRCTHPRDVAPAEGNGRFR